MYVRIWIQKRTLLPNIFALDCFSLKGRSARTVVRRAQLESHGVSWLLRRGRRAVRPARRAKRPASSPPAVMATRVHSAFISSRLKNPHLRKFQHFRYLFILLRFERRVLGWSHTCLSQIATPRGRRAFYTTLAESWSLLKNSFYPSGKMAHIGEGLCSVVI